MVSCFSLALLSCRLSLGELGVHRWQGCALHAMLEQGSISATGSPLAGQPPEMRSRAPQSSGKVDNKKTALPKQSRRDASENKSALGELGCTTCSLQTVLREFLSCFSLIFRAFLAFCFSVIRCADHKKRPFFIQRQADETHHLLPQTTPLVYCTSLLHKCP